MRRRLIERIVGALRSENAGVSNENWVRIPFTV